jgi:uncharacterized protein (DUF3084 family)
MKLKYFVVGLVCGLVLAGVLLMKACSLDGMNAKLKTQYEELRTTTIANNEAEAKVRAEKDAEIAKLQGFIDSSNTVIVDTQGKIKAKDKTIAELEAAYSQAKTCPEQLANMTAQVEQWKIKFSLAENIISEKDNIISAWEGKFNAQVVISSSWKKQYEDELALRLLGEKRIAGLETGLKVAKAQTTISRIALGVAAGFIIYELVKK